MLVDTSSVSLHFEFDVSVIFIPQGSHTQHILRRNLVTGIPKQSLRQEWARTMTGDAVWPMWTMRVAQLRPVFDKFWGAETVSGTFT